jgi:hypothetical protein
VDSPPNAVEVMYVACHMNYGLTKHLPLMMMTALVKKVVQNEANVLLLDNSSG